MKQRQSRHEAQNGVLHEAFASQTLFLTTKLYLIFLPLSTARLFGFAFFGKSAVTGRKAAVCGEAAHSPLPEATAKTKPQVLSAAVPPKEESFPKPQRSPPLIIYRLPNRKNRLCGEQFSFGTESGRDRNYALRITHYAFSFITSSSF